MHWENINIYLLIYLIIGLFGRNYLGWMILPSIIFEEVFERCCYAFSNNRVGNFAFVILFWFVVGGGWEDCWGGEEEIISWFFIMNSLVVFFV
ncbi:MAG: hypothetical protein KJ600_04500 [Nanoarchaeota archaeon]|nr:hypothetical protein [Nanoarchaeota archaeon]